MQIACGMLHSFDVWGKYVLYLKGEMLRIVNVYSNQLLAIIPMTAPYVCVSRDHILCTCDVIRC